MAAILSLLFQITPPMVVQAVGASGISWMQRAKLFDLRKGYAQTVQSPLKKMSYMD